jgi:hypothetical protein
LDSLIGVSRTKNIILEVIYKKKRRLKMWIILSFCIHF